MRKIAIIQSNYIPWKGYFDVIAAVDEFIIYDDVQYTNRDWRNRNRIKTRNGLRWLSIPVGSNRNRLIRDVILPDDGWQEKHWGAIADGYQQSKYYDEISNLLQGIYVDCVHESLSVLNRSLIELICKYLGIKTKITYSWDYEKTSGKTERLVSLCRQAGADEYVSGPAASGYIDRSIFHKNRVKLSWFDYSGYPEYPQLWGEFVHEVSIIDLLFNCGKKSTEYMKVGRYDSL